jgi:hypothetical protein
MRHRAKKERWVREAVAITDAITKDGAGRYLCPLCLDWFSDLDDLSVEHAPPKSLGGRAMAVTCRHCNSRGGHTVDAELRQAETLYEFGSRSMTKPMRATAHYGDVEQRSEIIFGPEGLSIGGVAKQNHPDTAAAVTKALRAAAGDKDFSMTLSLRTPDFRKAAVGWLRAAYLIAFGSLGYLYVLLDELDPVREQIRDPDAEILNRYCVTTSSAADERRLVLVGEPPGLASVAVLAGNRAILLPSPTSPGTYDRLVALETWPPFGEQTLSGKIMQWPGQPVYALDRAKLARL